MITLQNRPALDARVRFRRFETDGIVIHQKSAEAIVVSDVATRFLELANGSRSVHDCAELLAAEFDAPLDVIERDLLHFAGELAELGVLEVTP
jgi:hypothetical protein